MLVANNSSWKHLRYRRFYYKEIFLYDSLRRNSNLSRINEMHVIRLPYIMQSLILGANIAEIGLSFFHLLSKRI